MIINHIAIYTNQLEEMKLFYEKYFGAVSNNGYYNEKKEFRSYFLTFDGNVRLELMQKPGVLSYGEENRDELNKEMKLERMGLTHLAVSVGSKENVDALTKRLIQDGYVLYSDVRTTGDGYYESCVGDPDGNRIEITI